MRCLDLITPDIKSVHPLPGLPDDKRAKNGLFSPTFTSARHVPLFEETEHDKLDHHATH